MTDNEKERWLHSMLNENTSCFEMFYIKEPGEDWKYINPQIEKGVDEDLHEKPQY